MQERQKPEPSPDSLHIFSFICPEPRVDEARTILSGIKGVSVNPELGPPTVRMVIGEPFPLEGVEMGGFAKESSREEILKGLAEAEIAGYSRPTQVMFGPFIEANPDPNYRPRVHFDEDQLIVDFDHTLSTPPENLNRAPGFVTTFRVHPDQEIYFGLSLMPRDLIRGLTNGLRSYMDDENLTPEQKRLIDIGVNKLNYLLKEDN